jgi:hypothetical protein
MITTSATSQNWKTKKQRKKPCIGQDLQAQSEETLRIFD